MPRRHTSIWRYQAAAAGAALGAVAGLVALSAPATAATGSALPAKGSSLIANGNFALPGPATHEGAAPTGWKLVDLGVEKKPFSASIGVYNAKGAFPPPKGNPDKSDIADDIFYEAGSSVGIEGIGGEQTTFKVKTITQANNPEVSFADVEVSAPDITVSKWADGGVEIDFTSAKKTYSLYFLNGWTPLTGAYAGKPVNTATTKYVVGKTVKAAAWNKYEQQNLNSVIKKEFGLKTYAVKDVKFVNIEDAVNAGSPYPNMNGYVADVAVVEGPASK
jgi:hypothetical protein